MVRNIVVIGWTKELDRPIDNEIEREMKFKSTSFKLRTKTKLKKITTYTSILIQCHLKRDMIFPGEQTL